ncbi:O-antigen ligase family protein [Thiorhodococcus minor]|uniref:O-antigen ligase family protein n=1 Tax=Thiorhodococcus minor TaxID=57489 RepID=A0A6M0JSZ0_9GAMM|nr:O-antigen ligase family protein [Thiorhodococcus minor]NEV60650.1 O-antigen ligase family protein [Thiorhodococcus minor]
MAPLSERLSRLGTERGILAVTPLLLALSAATINVAYYEVHGPTLHSLMLLSLVWLVLHLRGGQRLEMGRLGYLLSAIFLVYAVIAVVAAGTAGFNTDALDRLDHFSYFLAGVFLIPFLVAARVRPIWFWGAVAAAALLSGLYAYWEVHALGPAFEQATGLDYRAGGSKGKQIPFGDIATLAAVLSALAACVYYPRRRLLAALFVIAALGGSYASFASGTRGAWLFFPTGILVIALYLMQRYPAHRRQLLAALAALALAAGIALVQSEQIRDRFATAIAEVTSYAEGDGVQPGNSLGERFEMWRAAWMAFEGHPWLGIGVGQLNAHFKQAADDGLISQAIVAFNDGEGHTHAHNDYIHALATRGLIGLGSLLLLYLVPLGIFARTALMQPDPGLRAIGYAGILTILAYTQFSLTDSILLMRITAGYFVLLTCWLLAMSLAGRRVTSP